MLIRNVEPGDLPVVLQYAQDFMAYYPVPLEYKLEELADTLISIAEKGIFLIAEKDGEVMGGLGGVIVPHHYSPATLMATELFLWVNEEHRNSTVGPRLLKEFEEFAAECGCTHISMTSTVRTPNFKNYLNKKGYTEAETAYLKRI